MVDAAISNTAFAIAAVRAREADRPAGERLFEDPWARAFWAAASQEAVEGTERFLSLPFFLDGIRLRTRGIDDELRAAVAAGATQVVILGAGFDARALRLPELRGALVIEVDLERVLAEKRRLLGDAGAATERHAYVGCDLSAPTFPAVLEPALAAAGMRLGEGAVFVCEGLFAYLDGASIDRLLAFAARAGGPGARVVLDFGDLARDELRGRAAAAGFSAFDDTGYDALWRRYLPGEPHENAWVARLGVAGRVAR